MAYNKKFFNLGRGSYNNHSSLDNAAFHIYKTPDDTLNEVLAANYFPANFGFIVDNVRVGDIINIYASDHSAQYTIDNVLSPTFTLTEIASSREYTFITNLDGPYAAPPSATITLVKVGQVVTAQFPTVNATANSVAVISTSANVGAVLVPKDDVQFLVPVDDNGSAVLGTLLIQGENHPTDPGQFIWGVGVGTGSFTGAGSTGIIETSVSYITS